MTLVTYPRAIADSAAAIEGESATAAIRRPSKLNTLTTGSELATRAVRITWVGVERSSSKVT